MASTSLKMGAPDSVVNVKTTFLGATRRSKMYLRDMSPSTLEKQIRALWSFDEKANIVIERYSDSAASYVRLDPENIMIYRQLYRAAKAKSKLKLRITLQGPDREPPKPATIEDVSDTASTRQPLQYVAAPSTTVPTQSGPARVGGNVTLPTLSKNSDDLSRIFQNLEKQLSQMEFKLPTREPTEEKMQSSENPTPSVELAAAMNHSTAHEDEGTSPSGSTPAKKDYGFAICCNICSKVMLDFHYHCSICDDGDFDICPTCINQGVSCHGDDHWLIKRSVVDGQLVSSVTERLPPAGTFKKVFARLPRPMIPEPQALAATMEAFTRDFDAERALAAEREVAAKKELAAKENPVDNWSRKSDDDKYKHFGARFGSTAADPVRTCNSCIRELPDKKFVHCNTCEDFDLCTTCFMFGTHGHDPVHAFTRVAADTSLPPHIAAQLNPGRNQCHAAVCDGCDKFIFGIRHKCLDCPDWDYCSDCVKNASFIHPGHRFVDVLKPLKELAVSRNSQVHPGVCCDGPLCAFGKASTSYIRGDRYKCAVCDDIDFCGNCEASPALKHNKSHPLIKFKTPVRHVSVKTTGEQQDGQPMPVMGDQSSAPTEAPEYTVRAAQTVVDVKPQEPEIVSEQDVDEKSVTTLTSATMPAVNKAVAKDAELQAVFVRDSVADGSILAPSHVFEQTWVLRNDGETAWPAGCSVKFVGGDYMGHVDSSHPAGISELVSASESTVCYTAVAPGHEYSFTVLLRTPSRPGRVISYWRLTDPEGLKFGHRLWCDVNVRLVKSEKPASLMPRDASDEKTESTASSQMIFPKLEKETPEASVHGSSLKSVSEPAAVVTQDATENDEWDDSDDSDDGFLTDEEYDILDASDEEYFEEQRKNIAKK